MNSKERDEFLFLKLSIRPKSKEQLLFTLFLY